MAPKIDRWLYPVSICAGSALLFAVQPIVAKALLPAFGGSAGVWVTCMLYFQVVLLLGYFCAYLITRYLDRRGQVIVYGALLLASAWKLPLHAPAGSATNHPALSILVFLTTAVGLPYLVLCTTSPLLQAWYARADRVRFPYRLFALSNSASLLVLLAYPVIIESSLSTRQQLSVWSVAFGVFLVLAASTAVRNSFDRSGVPVPEGAGGDRTGFLLWIALSACTSVLWMAVANYLSQEVAPVPFLWVLPLGLYLLSFILCFESDGWYRRSWFRWLMPVAWVAMGCRLALQGRAGGIQWDLPVLSAALFLCCMFCHGELARMKPEPKQGLPFFYLMIALGGALGATFVGMVAPNVFQTYLELPIGIAASVLLGLALLYGYGSFRQLARPTLVAVAAFLFATHFHAGREDVAQVRNFYGALQVSDAGEGEAAARSLYNGKILHGVEFLASDRRRMTTAYYGVDSGVAKVLQARRGASQRVGIIGLGIGTVAAYGRAGDSYRFYEINPAVTDLASRQFHFLAESPAHTDVVTGDGRLALALEPPRSFDAIVLDAFSGDSIPVHLLTEEAFQLYFERLREDGILAINITNRYLDLSPVVGRIAEALGKSFVVIHNGADGDRQVCAADWAVLSAGDAPSELDRPRQNTRKVRLWTDDYSNLFRILR
jgi:spermidine synthase